MAEAADTVMNALRPSSSSLMRLSAASVASRAFVVPDLISPSKDVASRCDDGCGPICAAMLICHLHSVQPKKTRGRTTHDSLRDLAQRSLRLDKARHAP